MKKELLFFLILVSSCAPTRIVKPLEKGEKSLAVSAGGPLVNIPGIVAPLPFTSVSGATGLRSDLSLYSGINTTSLLFGVLHTDVGILKELRKPDGFLPGISIAPSINFMIDHWEWNAKFYPQFDLNFYWHYINKKNFFYVGSSNWFEFSRSKAHGELLTQHWVPDVHLGHTFIIKKMGYTLEVRYLAPFNENRIVVLDYISPGDRGAIGVYFGLSRRFK
ncbi:MAG: hypothetical protein ACK4ND_19020 [Cytophagaceae bacterium]